MDDSQRRRDLIQRFDQCYRTTERAWGANPTDTMAAAVEWLLPGTVLDLGGGDGRHALYLAHKGFNVTSVDISSAAVDRLNAYARQQRVQARITGIMADIEEYVPDTTYSNVISTFTLHFLRAEAFMPVLERMMEATLPGGLNVIDDFLRKPPLYRPDARGYWPEPGELEKLYLDRGWEVLYYSEDVIETKSYDEQGNPYQQEAAGIVARKPGG